MSSAASSIPAAVTAVMAMATAAVPAGTTVWLGPPPASPGANFVQIIGFETEERSPYNLGPGFKISETFVIQGQISSFVGSMAASESATAAIDIFMALEAALREDVTLGEVVNYSYFSQISGDFETSDIEGNGARIPFEIHCRNITDSFAF